MSEAVAHVAGLGGRRKRRRRRLPIGIGLCFVVPGAVVLMAVFGSLLAPQNPDVQNFGAVLTGPSGAHWLGTDALGRDVFSRLIVGARTGLVGPALISLGSLVIGDLLGLLAGYRGGRVDAVSKNGLYYGLYQFSAGTWRGVGGSGLPSQASAEEQTARAKPLYARSGAGPWPGCGKNLFS